MNTSFRGRRSIRLPDYNYSQNGAYFITICVQNRENRFGEIKKRVMFLNEAGEMVDAWWRRLFKKFSNVIRDEYVIMPNHFHGIVMINSVGAPLVGALNEKMIINKRAGTRPAPTIGEIIGGFKSITTYEYIRNVKESNWLGFEKRLWQRNYYEHIIRNEQDLQRIREYIAANPSNWEKDELFNT